ncbi:MAG: hypothetical protein JW969_03145, partial [Spirochaetales bacterium]|nr:hypothetical protein [Spirochaetales bacterium]
KQIYNLGQLLVEFADSGYIKSKTFYTKGISKIIRDDLLSYMRFIMKADDKYYKKHKLYQLPKMDMPYRILGFLYNFKWFRRHIHQNREMDKYIIENHQKIIEEMGVEKSV